MSDLIKGLLWSVAVWLIWSVGANFVYDGFGFLLFILCQIVSVIIVVRGFGYFNGRAHKYTKGGGAAYVYFLVSMAVYAVISVNTIANFIHYCVGYEMK